MIFRSRPIRTRLAILCGCLALLAAGVAYLLPRAWIVATLCLVAAGGGWLGWLLAGRTVRQIKSITATARRIDASHLHPPVGRGTAGDTGRAATSDLPPANRRTVTPAATSTLAPPRGRDEVSELAETIDAIVDRLERVRLAQRQFFADAVEAMKTPLAAQRALVGAPLDRPAAPWHLDQFRTALLEVTGQQERLIDELLTLVRSESPVTAPVPVELADIAYRVSDGLEPEARRAGIELRVSAGPACTPGDPVLLERLAQNLLQNAVRYNTADGWVRVATGTDGDTVHLTVANTGPVVPTGEVPALFEPFRRLAGRDGSTAFGCRGSAGAHRDGSTEAGSGSSTEASSGDSTGLGSASPTDASSASSAETSFGSSTDGGSGDSTGLGCGGSPGLGLSIVRSVALAHGGRVSAAPRAGGGLVVEVTLPATVN